MGLIHVLIACDLAATIPLAASAVHSTPSGSCKLLLLLLCCCCYQHTLRALKKSCWAAHVDSDAAAHAALTCGWL